MVFSTRSFLKFTLYLIVSYLSYHLFVTIINVSYKNRANQDYQIDIKNISQFYTSILKNNSEDRILELLPAIEQRVIAISPHQLAILINYNALLDPLSQTSVLIKDPTLNENLVQNLETLIRKKLNKHRSDTLFNIPANMILFVIHYENNQVIRYTVLGYQDDVFLKSYKFSLAIFYVIYVLLNFLILLRFSWSWFFSKKKSFKINTKVKKTNGLSSIKSSQNSNLNHQQKDKREKNQKKGEKKLPEKIKLVHSEVRALEKILPENGDFYLKKIPLILIKMFRVHLERKERDEIIKILLEELFDLEEQKNYKIYSYNKNNPYSYQLVYYWDWREGVKDIQKIMENKIEPLILEKGKSLLNGYPILLEEEKEYRYLFPLIHQQFTDFDNQVSKKNVVSLFEITTHQMISHDQYKETFALSLLLLRELEYQKIFRPYEKIDLSYLQKWLEQQHSEIQKIKIQSFLIVIQLFEQKKDFDVHAFNNFITGISQNYNLKKNEIVFFYEQNLKLFLGLTLSILEEGVAELNHFRDFLSDQIDLKFNPQDPTTPLKVVEKIKKKNKIFIQDFEHASSDLLQELRKKLG